MKEQNEQQKAKFNDIRRRTEAIRDRWENYFWNIYKEFNLDIKSKSNVDPLKEISSRKLMDKVSWFEKGIGVAFKLKFLDLFIFCVREW